MNIVKHINCTTDNQGKKQMLRSRNIFRLCYNPTTEANTYIIHEDNVLQNDNQDDQIQYSKYSLPLQKNIGRCVAVKQMNTSCKRT